jgi:hypothetical protein
MTSISEVNPNTPQPRQYIVARQTHHKKTESNEKSKLKVNNNFTRFKKKQSPKATFRSLLITGHFTKEITHE